MKRVLLFLSLISLPFSMISNVKAASYASDTLKGKVVTEGDGLYLDKYNEGRYVYKGANPNNFIKFNDELWRIISVEKDGTLKIIRAKHLGETMLFNTNDNGEDDGTYCNEYYKEGSGCNAWGKSESITGRKPWGAEFTGTVTKEASLNTYLNNDYYNKLNNDSKNNIIPKEFYFGVVDIYPTYTYDAIADYYKIIKGEKTQKWKGKIALANVSDILNATIDESKCGPGSKFDENQYTIENGEIKKGCIGIGGFDLILDCQNSCSDTNWLMPSKNYKYTDFSYLLLNPTGYYNGSVWAIAYHGFDHNLALNSEEKNNSVIRNWYNTQSYVRPVTHLRSDMKITNGDGSENSPYELTCDECDGTTNDIRNDSNIVVEVPPTSMFISIFIIGGFILVTIICIIIYIKVFKKKDAK